MARGRAVTNWPVIVAGGKERLHTPLAGQGGMAGPGLTRQGSLIITCVQETGCGTPPRPPSSLLPFHVLLENKLCNLTQFRVQGNWVHLTKS